MSKEEQFDLIGEIKNTCVEFGTTCNVKVTNNTQQLKAYSDNDRNIKISRSMFNQLSKDEVRSVAYHEVAHLVLKHPQTWSAYVNTPVMRNTVFVQELRHMQEYQADAYASWMLYVNQKPNELDTVLLNLVPLNRRNIQTTTHPSINNRVKHIQKYKRIYPSNYNFNIRR